MATGGLTAGCALKPPVENSGALAKDGVAVSVVGQRCTETVEPEWPGANLVETVVELQVANSGASAVTVHRAQLKLRGLDGRRVPSGGWCAADPIAVESGQTKTFTVEFMTRGGMSCTKPMQLDADTGITMGAAPVQVGAVTFVPSKV
ncbi:MAG TPA: hypothetical protein VLT58_01740 [Polyangia bacterium]|nr:hypothetical protein [Polyangia bacterium]